MKFSSRYQGKATGSSVNMDIKDTTISKILHHKQLPDTLIECRLSIEGAEEHLLHKIKGPEGLGILLFLLL